LRALNRSLESRFEADKINVLAGLRADPESRTGKTTPTDVASRQFCETIAKELEQISFSTQREVIAR
jgi:hypothetical protein